MQSRNRRSKYDLRCFCKGNPLLAKYGLDDRGRIFVHIKVYKQREVYSESIITDGRVKILCRYCKRWHIVVIRQPGIAQLEESERPSELATKRA